MIQKYISLDLRIDGDPDKITYAAHVYLADQVDAWVAAKDRELAAKDARIAELEAAAELWTQQSNAAQSELAEKTERIAELCKVIDEMRRDRREQASFEGKYDPHESYKVSQ